MTHVGFWGCTAPWLRRYSKVLSLDGTKKCTRYLGYHVVFMAELFFRVFFWFADPNKPVFSSMSHINWFEPKYWGMCSGCAKTSKCNPSCKEGWEKSFLGKLSSNPARIGNDVEFVCECFCYDEDSECDIFCLRGMAGTVLLHKKSRKPASDSGWPSSL